MAASSGSSLECRNCDIVPVDVTLGVCCGELVAQVELANVSDEVVLPHLRVHHETLGGRHETIDREERPSQTWNLSQMQIYHRSKISFPHI